MTTEDITYINFFISGMLVIGSFISGRHLYKQGYKKGILDSTKSCIHGGIHKWNAWKYYTKNVEGDYRYSYADRKHGIPSRKKVCGDCLEEYSERV